MKKIILCSLIFGFTQTAMPDDLKYGLIINAAKSNAELHLFSMDTHKNLPAIHEVFSEKSAIGLSTFADHPKDSGASLKKLLDDGVIKLNQEHIPINSVSFNLFGTDGMRFLPKIKQQAIYNNVKNYIATHYDFKIEHVQTLSGKMQGVYDWLDINYLEGNFSANNPSLGIIDMGDDTTQIAFLTQDGSKPKDEVTLSINHQDYKIFSKSFSRLGMDQAILQMNQDKDHDACYQKTKFGFASCSVAFNHVIAASHLPEKLIAMDQTQFALINRTYETITFFGVEDASQRALDARINAVCEMSWEQMKIEYADSGIPEETLWTMCADGTYLDQFFYDTLHLEGSAMWVTDKSHDGHKIDWTLGALLYKIIQSNSNR